MSLRRIVAGFVIGAVPAVVLGMLMGWFKGVRAFVNPLVAATYPIPKIALLPILLVIFGLGEASKVAIVAIAVFFPMLITTAHGVAGIDPILIQAVENYGAKRWRLGLNMILPATMPSIFTGLKLAAGISLLVIVAGVRCRAQGYRLHDLDLLVDAVGWHHVRRPRGHCPARHHLCKWSRLDRAQDHAMGAGHSGPDALTNQRRPRRFPIDVPRPFQAADDPGSSRMALMNRRNAASYCPDLRYRCPSRTE